MSLLKSKKIGSLKRFLNTVLIVLFFTILSLNFNTIASAQTIPTPDFTNGGSGGISLQSLGIDTSTELGGDPNVPFTAKYPAIKEDLVIDISPEVPKPGDIVTISIETYGIDINTQLILWKQNGLDQLKGIGQKKFSFTMGQSGTLTKIDVTVSPKNAPTITKSWTFSPVDVDILWEANTYTPPFYKGKALFTPEADVTFVAMPNIVVGGKRIDPSDIVYNWKIDGEVDGDSSGFGKNTFAYTGSIVLKPALIQAEVYAATNKSYTGINGFTLSNVYPQAIFYEDSPLYGTLYNRSIRNQFSTRTDAVNMVVAPYFFSTPDKNANILYDWNLNSSATDIPTDQNSALFKRKVNNGGTANVSVVITNPLKILQKAVINLGLLFN